MPRITVIILSWNGLDLLRRCMATVESQTYRDFEVIVVDNGSTDGTHEWLCANHPDARVIRNTENQGFCAGNNQAIREARGEFVFALNNDAEMAPDCLGRLAEAVDLDPEFGMFAARIMMYDRPNVFDSTGLLVYPDGVCRSRGWLEKDVGQYDEPDEVLGPNGCAALYRKTMLDDVGVFDERYFAYLEDLDLAFRGQLRGWKCRYVPDAVVLHKKSMTSGYHSAFKAHLVERNRIFNSIKLFPRRLLLLSPFYTLARYVAQALAAVTGKGISSSFARDYSHWQLLWILLRSYAAAFVLLPELWRERREIQSRRRLGALAVYLLMKKYRLPVLELTFKD